MKLFSYVILCMLLCSLADNNAATNKARKSRQALNYSIALHLIPKVRLIFKEVFDLWKIFLKDSDLNVQSALFQSKEHEMIKNFIMITSKVSALEQEVRNTADITLATILQAFPKIIRLELNLHELELIINQINFADEQLRTYLSLGYKNFTGEESDTSDSKKESRSLRHQSVNCSNDINALEEMCNSIYKRNEAIYWIVEQLTLENFAFWATGYDYNSLLSLLRRLNDLVAPNATDGLFKLMQHISQVSGNISNRIYLLNRKGEMNRIFIYTALSAVLFAHMGSTDEAFVRRSKPPDLSLVDNIRVATINTFKSLWRDLTESNDVNHNTLSDINLLREFERIHINITQAEDFINPSDNYLFASDWSYALVDGEVTNVNTFYETFVRFQKENSRGTRKPQIAWTDLAETYLQTSDFGISKSLEKIHRYAATETESENLFKKIQKEMRMNVCNLSQSPHQALYSLYNTVAIAELKGNTILQFSYMILRMYNKGNFTAEAELALANYEQYTRQKLEVIRSALSGTDRSIYRCDPKQYVEGVTYTKLTKLLQGYIENEVNLNPYGTCRENCKYYTYTEYNGCFKQQFCAHQPQCKGKVLECRYVDSDFHICTSSNPERRYDWVEYENGKILGNKGVCERKNLFKVDSWWRYLFWHCSYCLCLCDDYSQESDRHFNLREMTSDIEKNKVVTGVRIVKQNKIIHLQIQQGVLTPLALINQTSISWKPVDNYTVDDDNVENNVDFFTMNWMERAIDTDEVFGPPEHVVTGLRFRKIGTHLNLEVRVTPINFTTGEVFKADHSYWLGNDNTDVSQNNPRTEIILNNPDIPIRNGPHFLNSKHDQFVQFQPTSFETDAGQSTVPFLDSQVITSQGFPLSGIGLIHRGKPGSGGFIAPKLISYDFTPHLRFN